MAILRKNPELAAPSSVSRDTNESDYIVHSLTEVCFFLNGIMQEKSLISLHLARNSHSAILSSILAVDLQKKLLVLDYGINETLNQMALKSGMLRCVTSHNRIRIEFDCNNLQHIRFEGRNAFSADLPTSLKRLQRRNFYRIATPVANPATCVIPPLRQHEEVPLTLNLLDISCGGMALIDRPDTDAPLEAGMTLEHCRIELPEFDTIETTVRIVNISTAILSNGNTCPRIGCEFVNLSEKSGTLIQRYITRLEQQARKFDTKSHF